MENYLSSVNSVLEASSVSIFMLMLIPCVKIVRQEIIFLLGRGPIKGNVIDMHHNWLIRVQSIKDWD